MNHLFSPEPVIGREMGKIAIQTAYANSLDWRAGVVARRSAPECKPGVHGCSVVLKRPDMLAASVQSAPVCRRNATGAWPMERPGRSQSEVRR